MREEPIRPSSSPWQPLKSLASFAVRPVLLALFAFALLIGTPAPSAEGATVEILVGDAWFCSAGFANGVCPTTITVGDTVSWDFSGTLVSHTTTDCGGNCSMAPIGAVWDSTKVQAGGPKFQHTFNSTGVFLYYCTFHPLQMRGQITVTGAVGGVAELPNVDATALAETAPAGNANRLLSAVILAAAGIAVVVTAAWYARKRLSH